MPRHRTRGWRRRGWRRRPWLSWCARGRRKASRPGVLLTLSLGERNWLQLRLARSCMSTLRKGGLLSSSAGYPCSQMLETRAYFTSRAPVNAPICQAAFGVSISLPNKSGRSMPSQFRGKGCDQRRPNPANSVLLSLDVQFVYMYISMYIRI